MLTPSVTLSFHQPPVGAPAEAPSEPPGITRLRRELAEKTSRLEETLLNLDNLISPLDWLDAGDGFPAFGSWRFNRPVTRTQDRTHAPLNYLNEEEWRLHIAMARDLLTRNHLALGFRDHVSNFVGPVAISFVLKGQSPGATASGPVDADGDGEPDVDPLVGECTQAWEEWRALAEWGEGEHDREEECRHRFIVEGECTLRFFKGDAHSDGLPYVRHVEPELIRTPPGYSTMDPWGWGVKTRDDDDEYEEGIWICDPANVSEGRSVDACDYVRVKTNVDRTVKRGLSDFFPVAEHLRKVLGLLDNMGHVARLQAAIAWWEQYPTATAEQVQNQIRVGMDYSRLKLPPNPGSASTDVTNYEAGTVVRTEAGREVQPGPVASGVAGFAQVQSLLLRGVGFRWGCPSYFSGESDASFASVLVTGSPFVRITESRQERVKGFARAVAMRVLEFCEKTGRLPKGVCKRVRAVATARPVVIADEEKQARTFLSLYQQNCADPVEFIRKRGGDPKVVAANIAAWKKKFEPQQGQGAPGGMGGMPGMDGGMPPGGGGMGESNPAPPGSAGGDGSSPNAPDAGDHSSTQVGESVKGDWISEAGNPKHPVGVPYQVDGHWWVNQQYGKRVIPKHYTPTTQAPVQAKGTKQKGTKQKGTKQTGAKQKSTIDPKAVATAINGMLPDDTEVDKKIRKGKSSDRWEKKWEEALAHILGHGWKLSGTTNSPEDVMGTDIPHKDGRPVQVILDGKMSVNQKQLYSVASTATSRKLDKSADSPDDSVVCFVAVKYVPDSIKGQAEDGVYLQFGPRKTLQLNDNAPVDANLGPFKILDKSQLDALRRGEPQAIEALHKAIHDKIYNLDLAKYRDAVGNKAGENADERMEDASNSFDTGLILGADEGKLIDQARKVTQNASKKGKTQHAKNAVTDTPPEHLDEVGDHLIGRMTVDQLLELANRATQQAQALGASSTTSPTKAPKKKKKKKKKSKP
jgi:hypothetical protein